MKLKLIHFFRSLKSAVDNKRTSDLHHCGDGADSGSHLSHILEQIEKKRLSPRDLDFEWASMKQRIEAHETNSTPNVWTRKWKDKLFSSPIPAFSRLAIPSAIALILIISGSLFLLKDRIPFSPFHRTQEVKYQIVNVDFGNRLNIRLNDGTSIVADAGSEIRYPKKFSDRRDIHLKGEAYFEVARDPERPFYVHANHALVRVLGTKFNVRAWNENPKVTISVNEGKVALSRVDGEEQKSVILKKNEISFVSPNDMPTQPQHIDAADHLGWMKNTIKFSNATVEEVVAQLQRWYKYEFVIQDSTILNDRLTVHIMPTNVNDVLEVISLLTNTKIEKDSNRILLIPQK